MSVLNPSVMAAASRSRCRIDAYCSINQDSRAARIGAQKNHKQRKVHEYWIMDIQYFSSHNNVVQGERDKILTFSFNSINEEEICITFTKKKNIIPDEVISSIAK